MNILTFDVEEWFMSYDNSQIPVEQWGELPGRMVQDIVNILEFLKVQNVRATFFIMGWVAEHYPETVRAIAQGGHEIGYHSYYHNLPENQGPETFEADLVKGLTLLQAITGKAVTLYRAPRFSLGFHTGWTIPILLKHGITLSSSTMGGLKQGDRQIPQTPFVFDYRGQQLPEYPLNRCRTLGMHWVYTGSGYLRLLPLGLLKHLYARNSYNMAYFHPRDFDRDVPSTPLLPFYRNIMSKLGNSTTIPKLTELMSRHKFQCIGEVAIKDLPIVTVS